MDSRTALMFSVGSVTVVAAHVAPTPPFCPLGAKVVPIGRRIERAGTARAVKGEAVRRFINGWNLVAGSLKSTNPWRSYPAAWRPAG
jgi:hypothetical protein